MPCFTCLLKDTHLNSQTPPQPYFLLRKTSCQYYIKMAGGGKLLSVLYASIINSRNSRKIAVCRGFGGDDERLILSI